MSPVRITSTEAGAAVLIDGEPVGTTPIDPQQVDVGKHEIRLKKAGFKDFVKEIIVAGASGMDVAAALERDVHEGRLVVSAGPEDLIAIDGRAVGRGRWEGIVKSGGHTLRVPRFSDRYERLASEGALALPATLGVVANEDDPTLPVTIRAAALSQLKPRVLREVVTQVPAGKVATLRVPMHFLCDGSADVDAEQNVLNKRPTDETCVAGECVSNRVDGADLPAYDPADIFGGGTGQPDGNGNYDGTCIDVAGCLGDAVEAVIDVTDCTIAAPEGDFNVALQIGRAHV